MLRLWFWWRCVRVGASGGSRENRPADEGRRGFTLVAVMTDGEEISEDGSDYGDRAIRLEIPEVSRYCDQGILSE